MKLFRHKYLLFVLLSLFLAIGSVLWLKAENGLKDFGLNFFTEILGVVITVYIIDSLAQMREYERLKPLKLAEFEDAKNLFNRFISFWYVTYSRAVPEDYPDTFDGFLSNDGIGKIFDYLDVDSKPSQVDALTWAQWIQKNHSEWLEISNRFLERHSANADPELYKLIHAFVDSTIMKTIPMMNALHKTREKSGSLSTYLPKPKKNDYEVLQKMNHTLKSLNRKYYPSKSNADNITNYKPVKLENRKVDCCLKKDDVTRAMELEKAYLKKQEAEE